MNKKFTVNIQDALDELVKKGYLKKTSEGYVDSDRVKYLLKKGVTRKQIAKILDAEGDEYADRVS